MTFFSPNDPVSIPVVLKEGIGTFLGNHDQGKEDCEMVGSAVLESGTGLS